jgi:predicted MPP superfamily phosphohydrolase
VNASARLPAPYDRVWVCGVDDHDQGAPDADRAFAGADGVRIALLHSPDGLAQVGERDFAVAFMGHVHGGQFWLTPERSLVHRRGALARRYERGGLFRWGERRDRVLLVSRGIGQTTLPLRRGADPQVHLCTLRAPAERGGAIEE